MNVDTINVENSKYEVKSPKFEVQISKFKDDVGSWTSFLKAQIS